MSTISERTDSRPKTLDEGAKMDPKIPVEDEAGESLEPKRSVANEEEPDCFLPSISPVKNLYIIWMVLSKLVLAPQETVLELGRRLRNKNLFTYKGNPPSRNPEKTERALGFPPEKNRKAQNFEIRKAKRRERAKKKNQRNKWQHT